MADDYILLGTIERVSDPVWPFTRNDLGEAGAGHFYRPLWVLWNTGISHVFGGDAMAFHALNLLLFALITLEVYALARPLLGDPGAWIAGWAFALYPRHGESVAWVTGSTDLLATALGLGALLCFQSRRPAWVNAFSSAGLAAGAALSKESGFTLPALALLLMWGRRRGGSSATRDSWIPLAGILVAVLGVLIARSRVLAAVGAYTEYPWTPLRVIAVAASDVLAAVTPPQLQVLRHPVLLLFPALVLGLLAWGLWRLRTSGDRRRLGVVLVGSAWFGVTLAPALNLAVDLNNANGERLLFLPSVGLALVFAALVTREPLGRRLLLLGVAGLAGAALSLQSAHNWLVGGRLADRVLAEAIRLGPRDGELVLLSVPASYRNAHVFQGSLEAAVAHGGRLDLRVALCLPVQVRENRSSQVRIRKLGDGSYAGTTTWSAPFDFPVLRSSASLTADCSYSRRGEEWPPGLGLNGLAEPAPSQATHSFAFFDGYSLRPCC